MRTQGGGALKREFSSPGYRVGSKVNQSVNHFQHKSEPRFLAVQIGDVAIERSLQSFDVFSLLRAVMGRCRLEERSRA
jgi:hypothetical protein